MSENSTPRVFFELLARHSWMILAVVVSMCVLLTACASAAAPENEERIGVLRYERLEWQEQVRLSTGEVIVVKRGERRRRVRGETGSPGWVVEEAWLEADLPSVGHARWEGVLFPLVLDVTRGGEWYLAGVIAAHKARKVYGLSSGKGYVAFKLISNLWQRVPFSDFPESFKPNLLADTTELIWNREIPERRLVTEETKHLVDSNPQLDRIYRSIDRSRGE